MGEMADFFLEDVMEFENRVLDYRAGKINNEEAYDLGIIDETGSELYSGRQRSQTCRYCKTKGLYWNQLNNGVWRLFQGSEVHSCPNYHK